MTQEQQFDSQILIQQRTHEIKNLIRRTAYNLIEIGHKLHEVKQLLGHGHFGHWLKTEFNWSVATATKMMQASEQFKNVDFTNLNFAPSAIYLLAAPSIPPQARTEALAKARQGQPITYSLAKQIVRCHKSRTQSSESEQLPVATSQPPLSFKLSPILNPRVDRDFFEQYLAREWLRTQREKQYFSLILCVIDNFSMTQQELPKAQIETLFQIVSQGISKSLNRPTDVWSDYQPGQFLILLSNTSSKGVKQIAKIIYANINLQYRQLFDSQESGIPSPRVSLKMSSSVPSPEITLNEVLASLLTSSQESLT